MDLTVFYRILEGAHTGQRKGTHLLYGVTLVVFQVASISAKSSRR